MTAARAADARVPDSRDLLRAGEVAARSGIASSAVHFYERRGLITAGRDAGNWRRSPRAVLRRVAVIKAAQRTSVPLAAIGAALAAVPADRPVTARDWRRLSARWRSDLDRRIAALTALRDQLDGCIGCGCLSLAACPLRNPGDVLAADGPGARLLPGGDAAGS
jgi:MerR family redox-sensitive transcriptional activator SoxR